MFHYKRLNPYRSQLRSGRPWGELVPWSVGDLRICPNAEQPLHKVLNYCARDRHRLRAPAESRLRRTVYGAPR
jgi:hypothetical protein